MGEESREGFDRVPIYSLSRTEDPSVKYSRGKGRWTSGRGGTNLEGEGTPDTYKVIPLRPSGKSHTGLDI